MKQYICPHGERIVGSSDKVYCTAEVEGFDDNGNPEWGGGTDVLWDSQVTLTRNGKAIYICDGGEEHTLDECKPVDEKDIDEEP